MTQLSIELNWWLYRANAFRSVLLSVDEHLQLPFLTKHGTLFLS